MSKPNIIFVLGGPGAGKGTQCLKIVEHFGYVHLSAGDLLREERNRPDSEVGQLIENFIKEGKIVPVEITCTLLENAMKKSGKEDFLIDGFPRNKDNLDGWTKQLGEKTNVKRVLFFECDDKVCVERCLERGRSSGRVDDNEESLKKRIKTYNESTLPIIDHFNQLKLVSRIEAAKSVDEVFNDIQKVFKEL